MMTYTEFKKLARRGAFVRWTESGIVEKIESGPGGFWAINPVSGRRHRVWNRNRQGNIRAIWHCEEFDLYGSTVRMGDFYDAWKLGKPLRVA